ncbi:aldehyde dehydrogenase family protein [Halorarius halobius]|uniref:aldehyde dehydrogenase family protein n=1 Tax=Halorarius halobius TaxID=2962671 RepID=UPI0020CD5B89|nr:aldehyde dehydrogenase family protein [Halorarius halobius]
MVDRWPTLYVDGDWTPPESDEYRTVLDPATGEAFAEAPNGGAADVEAAVEAARRSFETTWSDRSAHERVDVLHELADAVEANADELAALETRENGKPLHESERDVEAAIEDFRYYAGAADKHYGETLPNHDDLMDMTVREPYGVVGTVIPWNWPPMHVADFLAPALAAGNTMVLKPAPETPLCALRMAELFDDLLPDGVFNVVPGGVEAGAALTSHPDVGKLAFTGNSNTGTEVLKSAAEHITPVMLELGGKNASVYFPDADLEDAVPGTVDSAFYNSGEACSSSERLLVHEEIHDEFLERFVERTRELVVGPGDDPDTDIGPLASQQQYDKVTDYIEVGKREGADLVYEGGVPDGDGYFVAPHVFDGVEPDMRIFNEEIFGPVISVTTFETEREAIELSNQVEYGLTGAVWSGDAKRAMRVAENLEVGFVLVNTYFRGGIGTPFGGYKRSGIGRKHAFEETMREFTRTKTIRYNTGSTLQW